MEREMKHAEEELKRRKDEAERNSERERERQKVAVAGEKTPSRRTPYRFGI